MTDIALVWNAAIGAYDVAMNAGGYDLLLDEGLNTASIISICTDAQAPADATLPGSPQDTDRRGSWMDAYPGDPTIPPNSDSSGSLFWLLTDLTQEAVVQAQDYAAESHQWMIDDGVATAVDAVGTVVGVGILEMAMTVTKGANSQVFNPQWVLP